MKRKEPFGRHTCKWDIKMEFKHIWFEGVEWMQQVHNRVHLQAHRKSLD
jgi:hypothetical protein